MAAGLLRIHFHDCLVQGCDGSLLLIGETGDQKSPPNLALRPKTLAAINDLRDLVVSCADITTLAARESVFLSGGPCYEVPLGRRDGLTFPSNETTLASLPPPFFNVTSLLNAFEKKDLGPTDLVALSGAHTIGIAHCSSFARLFPDQDPDMDAAFAAHLFATCPTPATDNSTFNDIRTPNFFDAGYFINLLNRRGLFTSDQELFNDARTRPIVERFVAKPEIFFQSFAEAMVKMGRLDVLTGNDGEVRKDCTVPNSFSSQLSATAGGATAQKPAV
ncbi:Peroxidase 66 [Cocos nucifera]|uniref:peroxidase n=1 Tax=Cocos nucifera TaxID=13894 RepID=A0A8K0IMH6_COCNU|nr:Peroxidase 66 [Cocos nucifera]